MAGIWIRCRNRLDHRLIAENSLCKGHKLPLFELCVEAEDAGHVVRAVVEHVKTVRSEVTCRRKCLQPKRLPIALLEVRQLLKE